MGTHVILCSFFVVCIDSSIKISLSTLDSGRSNAKLSAWETEGERDENYDDYDDDYDDAYDSVVSRSAVKVQPDAVVEEDILWINIYSLFCQCFFVFCFP
jgi:hypothetical protein